MNPFPPLGVLREQFRLDPESPSYLRKTTGYIGSLSSKGYYRINWGGKTYAVHRIVWSLANGSLIDPNLEIDHVNNIKTDNRPENLRACTASENRQNVVNRPIAGCSWRPDIRKWKATLQTNGKSQYLGIFNTAEEARAAYLAAKAEQHPFSPAHRSKHEQR